MPRPRNLFPCLKHLDFFEALADEMPPDTPRFKAVRAGLLTLRFIDQWVHFRGNRAETSAGVLGALKQAIHTLSEADPLRRSLADILAVVLKLPSMDIAPALPKLFAYGMFLEEGGELALAADVYESVVRLISKNDAIAHGDLLFESLVRAACCRRTLSSFSPAEILGLQAIRLARQREDIASWFRARIGIAATAHKRGNLSLASKMFESICLESEAAGCNAEYTAALHDMACVAWTREQWGYATSLISQAYERQNVADKRDRMLADLGGLYMLLGRYDDAKGALSVVSARATDPVVIWNTRVNMVALSVRTGDQDLFYAGRARLAGARLPPEIRAGYCVESARGFRVFGKPAIASHLLLEAGSLTERYGLYRCRLELHAMLAS